MNSDCTKVKSIKIVGLGTFIATEMINSWRKLKYSFKRLEKIQLKWSKLKVNQLRDSTEMPSSSQNSLNLLV